MEDTGFTPKQKLQLAEVLKPTHDTLKRLVDKVLEQDRRLDSIEERLSNCPTRNEWQIMYDNMMKEFRHNETEMAAIDSRVYRCEEKLGLT